MCGQLYRHFSCGHDQMAPVYCRSALQRERLPSGHVDAYHCQADPLPSADFCCNTFCCKEDYDEYYEAERDWILRPNGVSDAR